MKTLGQFKEEEGITKIDLLQGNGRMYATVNEKNLVVSSKCDMSKPLFVIQLEKDKDGKPLQNVYAITNSVVKVAASV